MLSSGHVGLVVGSLRMAIEEFVSTQSNYKANEMCQRDSEDGLPSLIFAYEQDK